MTNMYLITHNVSADQSAITVNRTNVTLYGVQPGETYSVRITPYLACTNFSALSNSAQYALALHIEGIPL